MKAPVDLSRAVVINVDVQNAFGKEAESDKLRALRSSEGSEIERAAELSKAVHQAGGAVIVTKDWHTQPGTQLADGQVDERAAGEFQIYGQHALAGSRDAELNRPLERAVAELEAKEGRLRTVVPVDKYDSSGRAGSRRIIEVHKNVYDVTKRVDVDGQTRPHAAFLQTLATLRAQGVSTAILTGKIAEVCVRAAASSLHELFPDLRIIVAEDAVSSMPSNIATSLGLNTKEEVMAALEKSGIEVLRTRALLPRADFALQGLLGA